MRTTINLKKINFNQAVIIVLVIATILVLINLALRDVSNPLKNSDSDTTNTASETLQKESELKSTIIETPDKNYIIDDELTNESLDQYVQDNNLNIDTSNIEVLPSGEELRDQIAKENGPAGDQLTEEERAGY